MQTFYLLQIISTHIFYKSKFFYVINLIIFVKRNNMNSHNQHNNTQRNLLNDLKEQLISSFGKDGCIFFAKSIQYSQANKITKGVLFHFLELLRTNFVPPEKIINYKAVCYYFLSKYDPIWIRAFVSEIVPPNPLPQKKEKELLFLYYNILQFEDTYHTKTPNQLIPIEENLKIFAPKEKVIENYLLFNYYKAIGCLYNKDYDLARNLVNNNLLDICEEVDGNQRETPYFKYFSLQNTLLTWRILQANSSICSTEFLSLSNELYVKFKEENIELASKVCLAVTGLYEQQFEYGTAIKSLEEIYCLLKKHTLKGDCNINDSLLIYFQILAKLNSLYIMIGDDKNSLRILKKIEKNLLIIDKEEKINPKFKHYYMFLLLVVKNIVYNGRTNMKINEIINNLVSINERNIKDEAIDVNLFSLMNQGLSTQTFYEDLKKYTNELTQNAIIPPRNFLNCLFYCYNYLSYLSKVITTDPNKKQQKEYHSKIQAYSKLVIGYIINHLNEQDIVIVLKFDYIKSLLVKIYYFYYYSFYYIGDLESIRKEMIKFDTVNAKLGLKQNKSYGFIFKLEGDICFRQKNYNKSISNYEMAFSTLSQKNKIRGTILFNLGLCYFYINNRNKGREYLYRAYDETMLIKKETQNLKDVMELQQIATNIDDVIKRLKM